jgi:hypothetical protein
MLSLAPHRKLLPFFHLTVYEARATSSSVTRQRETRLESRLLGVLMFLQPTAKSSGQRNGPNVFAFDARRPVTAKMDQLSPDCQICFKSSKSWPLGGGNK